MGRAILILFPNLEALNLKNYVAMGIPLDLNLWYIGYGIGAIYIVSILIIGAWVFSKKSFDNA